MVKGMIEEGIEAERNCVNLLYHISTPVFVCSGRYVISDVDLVMTPSAGRSNNINPPSRKSALLGTSNTAPTQ